MLWVVFLVDLKKGLFKAFCCYFINFNVIASSFRAQALLSNKVY